MKMPLSSKRMSVITVLFLAVGFILWPALSRDAEAVPTLSSASPNPVVIVPGGQEVTLTLHGSSLDQIASCAVVRNNQVLSGVTAVLSPPSASSRQIKLQAKAGTPAGDAQLRFMSGSNLLDVPLNVFRISISTTSNLAVRAPQAMPTSPGGNIASKPNPAVTTKTMTAQKAMPNTPGASTANTARPAVIPKPVFISMVPSSYQLIPTRESPFTVTGTDLDSVTNLSLINPRNPLWRLPAKISSKTSKAINATVKVPRYVAQGPYKIQAEVTGALRGTLTIDTGLTVRADEYKPGQVWTEFLPEVHGFNFGNRDWGAICFQIVGGHLEYKPDRPHICDNDWGLCGGMSFYAGGRYRSRLADTHSLDKYAAKPAIIDAQFRTLDGPTVAKFLEWIYSPDEGHKTNPLHSIGYRMAQDWNGPIKGELDAYKPVVLGLIFDKSATVLGQISPGNVGKLTKQHQVLGFAYARLDNNYVRIYAYDPNIENDTLILTFHSGSEGVTQGLDSGQALPADRRPVRGIMFIRSVP